MKNTVRKSKVAKAKPKASTTQTKVRAKDQSFVDQTIRFKKPELRVINGGQNKFAQPFSKFTKMQPPANAFSNIKEYGIRVGRIKKIA